MARAEIQRRNLTNVAFVAADVHTLDFPDDTFDIVHAHQVLQHVADPVGALREMRRVCAPGGIVAARDADYAGFIWFPQLPGAGSVARPLPTGGSCQRRRTGCGPAVAVVGPAGRIRRHHAHRAASGATRRPRPANGGEECGPTGFCTRMWLANCCVSIWPRPRSSRRSRTAWRAWAAAPDGWLAIPHGEILCRA